MSTSNILAIYYQASKLEVASGKVWYTEGQNFITALSEEYGYEPKVIACVVACLSPRNRWERNLIDAENMIKMFFHYGYEYTLENSISATYHKNRISALDFLAGKKDINTFYDSNRKSGLKIMSFAYNLMGVTSLATIDVHAASVWLSARILKSNPYNLTNKRYHAIANDYKTVAEQLGLETCQLQAICWLAWKRIHNI